MYININITFEMTREEYRLGRELYGEDGYTRFVGPSVGKGAAEIVHIGS